MPGNPPGDCAHHLTFDADNALFKNDFRAQVDQISQGLHFDTNVLRIGGWPPRFKIKEMSPNLIGRRGN
jgi:hypothetical protein